MKLIDNRLLVNYDSPVYSDAELTKEVTGPHLMQTGTSLPVGIFFSTKQYVGIVENSLGKTMFKVTFSYPGDVQLTNTNISPGVTADSGGVFEKE